MKKWTIGNRVAAVCAVLSSLVLCACLIGILGMSKMRGTLVGIDGTYGAGIRKLGQVQSSVMDVRASSVIAALPALSVEQRAKQIQWAEKAEAESLSILRELDASGAVGAEERPLFSTYSAKVESYLATLKKVREMIVSGKLDLAATTWEHEGAPKRESLIQAYAAEMAFNQHGMTESIDAAIATGTFYAGLTWGIFLFTVIAAGSLAFFIIRAINGSLRSSVNEIRSSSEQVSDASGQVASASESLAQICSQQAASLEETSASGQEVTAMTQRNSESSQSAAQLMKEVDGRVNVANQKLEEMVESMNEITSSSERIAKIIKVIDEIAFQTNILALNAAVEAARAGESGLGFAVVADEVRNLAQRCAQAAKDTTMLIEESTNTARNGRVRLNEVAAVVADITKSAGKVKVLVDEVSHGGVEQARGIDQISRALVQMEQTTQQSAASAEESASASQQLKAQAASMQHIVASLELLIQQSSSQVHTHVPARFPVVRPKPASTGKATSARTGLMRLQKAVGIRSPQAPVATPVAVAVSADKSSFPLDDSEFQEF